MRLSTGMAHSDLRPWPLEVRGIIALFPGLASLKGLEWHRTPYSPLLAKRDHTGLHDNRKTLVATEIGDVSFISVSS